MKAENGDERSEEFNDCHDLIGDLLCDVFSLLRPFELQCKTQIVSGTINIDAVEVTRVIF
jgi:hypothetical protein